MGVSKPKQTLTSGQMTNYAESIRYMM